MPVFLLILINGSSKMGVKFADIRKKLYLCRLLCASMRLREIIWRIFQHNKLWNINI